MNTPTRGRAALDIPMGNFTMTPRSALGLAWLLERAARTCDVEGDPELGKLLRKDAAQFRARAVNA